MKKTIVFLILTALLSALLIACGTPNQLETEPTEVSTTEAPIPSTQPANNKTDLTYKDIIDHLNLYADTNNQTHVTNLKEVSMDETGRVRYTFDYYDNIIHITVWETDGVADGIFVMMVPSQLRPGLSNSEEYSDEELAVICRGLVALPILPCEADLDTDKALNWHGEQMDATIRPDDDGVFLKCEYQSTQWKYSVSISTLSVMMSATKLTNNTQDNVDTLKDTDSGTSRLTLDDVIGHLNAYSDNIGLNHVADLTTASSEYVGETRYECTALNGQIHVILQEKDGVVVEVMAYAYLSSVTGNYTPTDKTAIATGLVILPLEPCEPDMSSEDCRKWHYGQIAETFQEYDAFWTSRYSSDEWSYYLLIDNEYKTVLLSATSLFATDRILLDDTDDYPSEESDTTLDLSSEDDSSSSGGSYNKPENAPTNTDTDNVEKPVNTSPSESNSNKHESTPKPSENSGSTEPTECVHSFTVATCTEASFCKHCGELNSSALGHTYRAATCTQPEICAVCGDQGMSSLGHRWNPITETVYHEEQGHYEDVQEAYPVQKYQCYACSHQSDTLDSYYSHFDSIHGNSAHYQLVRDMYEQVNAWEYKTVTKWIVDEEAYEETITVSYQCADCGEQKSS